MEPHSEINIMTETVDAPSSMSDVHDTPGDHTSDAHTSLGLDTHASVRLLGSSVTKVRLAQLEANLGTVMHVRLARLETNLVHQIHQQGQTLTIEAISIIFVSKGYSL
ncbi:hypothetical protein Lal_00003427 [Lupinus albus]|nr:hypothetical protein Lal_00003427 [Lupinus albus]